MHSRIVSRISLVISGTALILICVSLVYAVIMRLFFSTSVLQATDLASLLLVVFMFFAIAHDEAEGEHVRVDALINVLPGRIRTFCLNFVSPLIGVLFSIVMIWQGGTMFWKAMVTNQMSVTAWQYPLAWGIVWIPLCFVLVLVLMIAQIAQYGIQLFAESGGNKRQLKYKKTEKNGRLQRDGAQ